MIEYTDKDKLLKGYTFVDLFCGIGGFHLALTSLGAKCVFASDINKKACDVYEKNFHMKPAGDITKIKCRCIPSHDILCAGFPCQPFSISGNQNGFEDKNGKLFFEIIRIARFHKPKIIFLENVRNLISHNDGKTIQVMKDKLTELGYRTFLKVLSGTDFGVPQARKRVYIVAIKKKYHIKEFEFPKPFNAFSCVEDIMFDKVSETYYVNREYIIDNSINQQRTNKLVRIGSIGPGRQGERIYSIHGQATTLSSQGGGPGGKTGIYYTNNRIRTLCPRECARLMGFPDSFILSGTDFDSYTQLGNSVVVNVIQEIAKEFAKKLEEKDNEEH